MTPERWRQVTRVYGAVMTKPPAARAAALAELCPDDEALRKEVESLLADDSGAALLDRPLADVAASVVQQDLTGRTLGPYRLESAIGAGGMGQVYRASDTRLHRTVAVKVLAASLAHDPQFRARFDREAKAIAALNHPHICTLHDIGSSDGVDYLVMEYVDGETLSSRLERGALPFEQALTTAIQIAEALAAAHRQGIVHRDLKPGNVMLTKSGVKLLDFGLAKPTQTAGLGAAVSMLPTTPPMGPTRGTPLTVQGTILGTLQYMAPEQLEGKEADARTDIFAFGAIAYEMFTGKRAFSGGSQASLIGAIMHAEPQPMTADQPLTPASLERVVKTCLAKSPEDRWQTAHDLARELRWIAEGASPVEAQARSTSSRWLPRGVTTTALIAATAMLAFSVMRKDASPVPVQISRFSIIGAGANALWFGTADPSIAITPDGSRFVYIGNNGTQLFVRSLDRLEPVAIASGGSLRSPFVSRDGRWVGFIDGNMFKRVQIEGGAPIAIGSLQGFSARGVTWTADNTLIFASNDTATGLLRMPALSADATTEVLTRPDSNRGEADHLWPSALPDGSGVVFTITAPTGGLDAAQIAFLDINTKKVTTLLRHGTQPRYVPSGHLTYASNGTLFAVPFDLKRHEVTGPAVSVQPAVRSAGNGAADYVVSDTGTLAYVSGSLGYAGPPRTLMWVDRSGNEQPLGTPVRPYAEPRISPDGSRIAVYSADQDQDLWLWDLRRSTLARFTSTAGAVEQSPVWTPDGKRIIFASDRGPNYGVFNLWWQSADDDTQPAGRLTVNDTAEFSESLTPDGALIFREMSGGGRHLMRKHLGNEAPATELIPGAARTRNGEVSPDGRWLTYESDASGTFEVYVRSVTGHPAGQWALSAGGGTTPHWSRSGKELFFVNRDGAMMKVDVNPGAEWSASTQSKVVAAGYFTNAAPGRFEGRQYDVAADGRFLMIKPQGDAAASAAALIVEHFDAELKARVSSK